MSKESVVPKEYQTVYISIAIKATFMVLSAQRELCKRFDLIPRPEFHITIGYLGYVSPCDIEALGDKLRTLDASRLADVSVIGTGGAFQPNSDTVEYIKALCPSNSMDAPRVVWWSAQATDAMITFRSNFISAAIALGLDSTHLRPTFFPHITVGSGGPKTSTDDWSLWDIHTIAKEPTLGWLSTPENVEAERLHITSVPAHPQSLYLVTNWPKS